MIEILRNKNLTTRFQILVEIANSGPNVQQRDIAGKLGITPQAVSDYIARLIKEGMLGSEGRSCYRVTSQGVNWIIKALRELNSYNNFVKKAITNISICAAIAESDLARGQKVGLTMKDGLLFARDNVNESAVGMAVSAAGKDQDVAVTNIEGIVTLQVGKVTVLRIPGIEEGGSRAVDVERLKSESGGRGLVGAIGIESIVALKGLNISPVYIYGVTEAIIEAAKSGLSPLIICVDSETPALLDRLEKENIEYELIDLRRE